MKKLILASAMVIVVVAAAGSVFAADKKMGMMEMTPEQRSDMATMHEKMATCLRSEKPMAECHKEMKASCHDKMGMEGCPMMGDMKHRGKKYDKSSDY